MWILHRTKSMAAIRTRQPPVGRAEKWGLSQGCHRGDPESTGTPVTETPFMPPETACRAEKLASRPEGLTNAGDADEADISGRSRRTGS
jgi:hypothetical protein